jgi:hypothetical protein
MLEMAAFVCLALPLLLLMYAFVAAVGFGIGWALCAVPLAVLGLTDPVVFGQVTLTTMCGIFGALVSCLAGATNR